MTQTELILTALDKKTLAISKVSEITNIQEPSVRRVLGKGAKAGIFERVERGIYSLYRDTIPILTIRTVDSLLLLPILAEQGLKADMIFLDIPYKTRATYGGNRPMRFDTIDKLEFGICCQAFKEIVRTVQSPVYYIFSNAPSGQREMDLYTNQLLKNGFKIIEIGEYHKFYQNGRPVINVKGRKASPEGVMLLNLDGEFTEKEESRKLNFQFERPSVKDYPTQKPIGLCRSLVRQGTIEDDLVMDSFVGSGTMAEASLLEGRKFLGLDKSGTATELSINRIRRTIQ